MEENARELLFVRGLEKVRRIGKEQGNHILESQVKEGLSGLDLSEGQLQMVYDYLAKYGIVCAPSVKGGPIQEDGPAGKAGSGEEPGAELTEEERDCLKIYLEEIAKLPVCEEEELNRIAIAAMEGDRKARDALTENLLRDVADIAKLYGGQGVYLEDLIGEGNMALAMELQKMEGADGWKIPSGAFSWVRGEMAKRIMDAMESLVHANEDNVKADRKVAEQVNLVADKARELAEELRGKVTPEELASETGMSVEAIRDAMRMSGYKIEDILDD